MIYRGINPSLRIPGRSRKVYVLLVLLLLRIQYGVTFGRLTIDIRAVFIFSLSNADWLSVRATKYLH